MANHQPPANALAGHLVSQTLSSISVLESLSIISPQDASLIRNTLPSPSGPFPALNPSAQRDLASSFSSMNLSNQPPTYGQQQQQHQQQQHQQHQPMQSPVGPAAPALPPRARPEVRAKALWAYDGTEADDLTFRAGDTIIIDEEVNEQWFRGRVIPQGQSYPLERRGLFPSNYIEKLPPASQSPSYFPPQLPAPSPHSMVPYQPSGPPQQYYDQKQPMYPQQQGQMVMMQPQQQVQGGVVVQQSEEQRKGKFGKIGGQLGNAAVTGFGFGAGSAVASEMVHAIF